MTQQQEIKKEKMPKWKNHVIIGNSMKAITIETYSFRQELEEASRKSRNEIRNLLKDYNKEKQECTN
jgi:hypothetical protein